MTQEEKKPGTTEWLEEYANKFERKKTMDDFIEQHELPKDTTIAELLEFCRKQGE